MQPAAPDDGYQLANTRRNQRRSDTYHGIGRTTAIGSRTLSGRGYHTNLGAAVTAG